MNTDIYTYVHTYHSRVDVEEVLLVLVLLAVKSGGNKEEGRRRTVSSHEEREIGRSIDSAHSRLFIIHLTLLGGSINRISSAQDGEDRSSVFFLCSRSLWPPFILTTDGKEKIIMQEYGGRGGRASSQQKTRTSHHLPPLAPRTDKLDSSSSTHFRPSGLTATSTSSSTSAGSSRATRLSHRSRAGCWTCRGRKVGISVV